MQAHIVRLETVRTRGWQVRFDPDDPSTRRYASKLFSDRLHGGKRKSKKAAEEFLERHLEENGFTLPPRGRRKGMMFPEDPARTLSTNISGRTGVYRGEHIVTRENGTQEVRYWAASYSVAADGTRKKRSRRFYIGPLRTEAEARELAIRFREGWEEAYLSGGIREVKRFFRQWDNQ